jgi:hypothetical protein
MDYKMESSGFDVQIYSEFNGPLSPIGHSKVNMQPQQVGTHSIHVMLGMPAGAHPQHHQQLHQQQQHHQLHPHSHGTTIDLCAPPQHQRLPEVHNLLPGASPKLDHYKAINDYNKMDYTKIDSSSYSPNGKLDYVNGGKLEAYSKLDYHQQSIAGNGKLDYSPSHTATTTASSTGNAKHDYDQMNSMFQHPQAIDSTSLNGMGDKQRNKSIDELNNGGGNGNNGGCDTSSSAATMTVPGDASSTTSNNKKNDSNNKKKTDSNGVKKKKTR